MGFVGGSNSSDALIADPPALESLPEEQFDRSMTDNSAHPPEKQCPNGHALDMFRIPEANWWCSVCEKEFEIGTIFYSCRGCDYDKCEYCVETSVNAGNVNAPCSNHSSPSVGHDWPQTEQVLEDSIGDD